MDAKLLLGKYLAKKNKLTKADAIVVVSGEKTRVLHAIKLYKQGYAPTLIFSGGSVTKPISDAMKMKQMAMKKGIEEGNIILEEKATNTYENALLVKEITTKKQYANLILVTSPYHQRRVHETFAKVFEDDSIVLQNAPSIFSPWQYYNWWKFNKGISLTFSESVKLLMIKVFGVYK